MKMPDNISPEIAAYIKALQTENSKLHCSIYQGVTDRKQQAPMGFCTTGVSLFYITPED